MPKKKGQKEGKVKRKLPKENKKSPMSEDLPPEIKNISAYCLKGLPLIYKLFYSLLYQDGQITLYEGTPKDFAFTNKEKDILNEFFELPESDRVFIIRNTQLLSELFQKHI